MPTSNYLARVRNRYLNYLPTRLAEIPEAEREPFFQQLAQDISNQVLSMVEAMDQRDLREEPELQLDMMARIGRHNMNVMCAEERILAEMLPTPSIQEEEDYDEEDEEERKPREMTDDDIMMTHNLYFLMMDEDDLDEIEKDRRLPELTQLEELRAEYAAKGYKTSLG